MSFTFLCGMLACCISGCVSVNRFGFAIEGAWCALDRIYYDSLNGQLKTTEPKWKGFANTYEILTRFNNFLTKLRGSGYNLPTETFEFDKCKYNQNFRQLYCIVNLNQYYYY